MAKLRLDLSGKVAIVTGAGGDGIGAAYATALASAGASLVIADMNAVGAEQVAASLRDAGHQASAVTVDIRDSDQTAAMVAFAQTSFGGLDIIVNNAAYMPPVRVGLLDYPLAEWQKNLDINLTGTLNCIRAAVPALKARGGGRIINQSSIGAYLGGHAYSVTKLGVQAISMQFADELGAYGITVNCIAPGTISTPAGDRARADNPGFDQLLATAPLGGVAPTDELIGALLYFASDSARWVTGQVIRVDGGLIRRAT